MQTLAALEAEALTCTRCRLAEGRTQVVFGVGDPHADLMFVGEGPGREEDLKGEPFVGRSGQLLDKLVLEEMGLTRDAFYIGNVVCCRPPGNRDPNADEIEACRPWLLGKLD
ncbi:MAG TPA: uracil-DNA glycosylase, partial [Acidimicrobiales bacterium]|nr:uracil-DNA glycosylase [Acidimicrobiales bacterium]